MIEIQLQAALAAVAVLAGLGVGYALVRSIIQVKPVPIKLGGIEALDACRLACDQWDGARSERCQAQADEAAAKDRVNSDQVDLGIAVAAQSAALAAAIACDAIPFLGYFLAIAFWVTFGVLTAVVAGLALNRAFDQNTLDETSLLSQSARANEAEARKFVLNSCSDQEANACLSRSSPC